MIGQRSLRNGALVAAALCAAGGAVVAACTGDEPWRALPAEQGQSELIFSPTLIALVPASQGSAGAGAGGAGMAGGMSQSVVTIFGALISDYREPDEGYVPAEGTHVDVVLGTTCPDQITPVQSDNTQFVHLIANPSNDANAPCKQTSQAQVHCVLSANGTASFAVAATSFASVGQSLHLIACSNKTAHATILIGRELPDDAQLEMTSSVTLGQLPIACDPETTLMCNSEDVRRTALLEVRAVEKGAGGGGAGGGGTGGSGTPILGTLVNLDVRITPEPDTNGAITKGSAGLSLSSSCSQMLNRLPLLLDATAKFYVCADGREGKYGIDVLASGVYAAKPIQAHADVTVLAQPAHVAFTSGCSDQGTGGGAMGTKVKVLDCDTQPVPGLTVAPGQTTNKSGEVCLPVAAATPENLVICKGKP
jgi:hypothetical protein